MTVKHCLSVWDTLGTMKTKEPTAEMISQVFALMGRKGGPARAKALTAKRRTEIAKKAAAKRWGKK